MTSSIRSHPIYRPLPSRDLRDQHDLARLRQRAPRRRPGRSPRRSPPPSPRPPAAPGPGNRASSSATRRRKAGGRDLQLRRPARQRPGGIAGQNDRRHAAIPPRRPAPPAAWAAKSAGPPSASPSAERSAFATAAVGGTIGTSPTPARAERAPRVRHLHQDRLDHRQVGGHRHAVVEEARDSPSALRRRRCIPRSTPSRCPARRRPASGPRHRRGGSPGRHPAPRCSAAIVTWPVSGSTSTSQICDGEAGPRALRVERDLGADRPAGPRRASPRWRPAAAGRSRRHSARPAPPRRPSTPPRRRGMSQIMRRALLQLARPPSRPPAPPPVPMAKVTRLPPVSIGKPIEAVSATIGRTFSYGQAQHLGRHHRHARRASRRCRGCGDHRGGAVLVDVHRRRRIRRRC